MWIWKYASCPGSVLNYTIVILAFELLSVTFEKEKQEKKKTPKPPCFSHNTLAWFSLYLLWDTLLPSQIQVQAAVSFKLQTKTRDSKLTQFTHSYLILYQQTSLKAAGSKHDQNQPWTNSYSRILELKIIPPPPLPKCTNTKCKCTKHLNGRAGTAVTKTLMFISFTYWEWECFLVSV